MAPFTEQIFFFFCGALPITNEIFYQMIKTKDKKKLLFYHLCQYIDFKTGSMSIEKSSSVSSIIVNLQRHRVNVKITWWRIKQITQRLPPPHLKMCHLRHRLITLLFCRKTMFRSQDIQVFEYLTIPWFTKSVTSWLVIVHEKRYIFEYISWSASH